MKLQCYGKYNQFSNKCFECDFSLSCKDKQISDKVNKVKQTVITNVRRTKLEYEYKYFNIVVPIDHKKFKHMQKVKVTIENIIEP